MKFRTEIEVAPYPKPLGYEHPVMLAGSCFSEYIGGRMEEGKLPVLSNPFGVLYNPASIARSLRLILANKLPEAEDLVLYGKLWHSLLHHSRFSRAEKGDLLDECRSHTAKAHGLLKKCSHLFITWGTARVYVWNDSGKIVANCHKIPAKEFTRELLEPEEIIYQYRNLIHELRVFNPGMQILFTISPVRHWKDGARGNQVSKSVLHLALQKLLDADGRLQYFPSYELQMDDLRDYRFYAADLLHPSDEAVDYIWKKFMRAFLKEQDVAAYREIRKITHAARHRRLTGDREGIRRFAEGMLKKISLLEQDMPGVDFRDEKEIFMKMMP